MTTCCCLQLATLACEVWHAHCQYPSFPPCTRLGALAKPSKLCNPPEAPRTPQPVAPPTNTELGRVGARCCEVWSAACVENIDSRMGLEPLDEGLRLRDRLCVEKEGRDTPAMLTCESRASLATTPAAFASESLATVARESSAATSDTLLPASPRPLSPASRRRRHPPPSPASPRSLLPAKPWSLSPARPRPPSPASHVRDECEHPPRTRFPWRTTEQTRCARAQTAAGSREQPHGHIARCHCCYRTRFCYCCSSRCCYGCLQPFE